MFVYVKQYTSGAIREFTNVLEFKREEYHVSFLCRYPYDDDLARAFDLPTSSSWQCLCKSEFRFSYPEFTAIVSDCPLSIEEASVLLG